MLGPVLAQALSSGRVVCPHCRSCLLAVGLRYASNSHYDTLGVQKTASQTEIRNAFLALSKQLHPDINQRDPKNHEKFVNLNEAYRVLKEPLTRKEYDMNLAVRINMERQARSASSSHVYGSSPWPGTNAGQQYEKNHQGFWDETIFKMRDKSKDKEYEGKPYYGFKNLQKLSNLDIVLGCFALMTAGALIHYFVISKSRELHKDVLDEKDKKLHSALVKARSYAKAHGNALQMQILQSKVKKTPLEVDGVSREAIQDAFTGVKK